MDSYTFHTPIGFLTIREEEQKLTNLFWRAASEKMMKNERHSDFLHEVYTQVNEYFAGRRRQFDVALKYEGTPFQQSVWRQLQKIPYGETRSYQEIAIGIGNEKAVRAVGQANNKNPIMIIIPCHRVIHKNGDIIGFACGGGSEAVSVGFGKGNGTEIAWRRYFHYFLQKSGKSRELARNDYAEVYVRFLLFRVMKMERESRIVC